MRSSYSIKFLTLIITTLIFITINFNVCDNSPLTVYAKNRDTTICYVNRFMYRDEGTLLIVPIAIFHEGHLFAPEMIPYSGSDPTANHGVWPRANSFKVNLNIGDRIYLTESNGLLGDITLSTQSEKMAHDDCILAFNEGLTSVLNETSEFSQDNEDPLIGLDNTQIVYYGGNPRSPTDSEKIQSLKIAQDTIQKSKNNSGTSADLKILNLHSVDLNNDGVNELIGSFQLITHQQKWSPPYMLNDDHYTNLFIIFTQKPSGLKADYIWMKTGNEESYEFMQYVGLVDINGDGRAEIIVAKEYSEGLNFVIYEKQGAAWKILYSGDGWGV